MAEHPLVVRALAECPPRIGTAPTPGAKHHLEECLAVAALLGFRLMPWQALVLRVLTEEDSAGRPRYRQATITVPRQNGKTALVLVLMFWRLLMGWQQVIYAAQKGITSSKKIEETFWPRLERLKLDRLLSLKLRRGHEADIKCGAFASRLSAWGGTEDSGHGDTLDLVLADEVWRHVDDLVEQALLSTLRTKRCGQFVRASTAGTDRSSYLKDHRDKGRAAVAAGRCAKARLCYFEWSAPDDIDDGAIDDLPVIRAANPALGYILDLEMVEADREGMTANAFKRTNLNIFVTADAPPLIPFEVWRAAQRDSAAVAGGIVIALDAEPTYRRTAYAVAADKDGQIQLIERFRILPDAGDTGPPAEPGKVLAAAAGETSLIDWATGLIARHQDVRGFALAVDPGPLGGFQARLEAAVGADKVYKYSRRERQHAAAWMFDHLHTGAVRFEQDRDFESAANEAIRTPAKGSAWEFGRPDVDADISPLVAAAMAHHAATFIPEADPPALRSRLV